MAATPTTPNLADLPDTGCGPDCIYIDGACRCYHGEPAEPPEPDWMTDIDPPF